METIQLTVFRMQSLTVLTTNSLNYAETLIYIFKIENLSKYEHLLYNSELGEQNQDWKEESNEYQNMNIIPGGTPKTIIYQI